MGEHKLKKEKPVSIFVGTPMFGGACMGSYTHSCIELQKLASQYNLPVHFSFLYNESLVQRGRNTLVRKFLASSATHLLFVDADITFNPIDIIQLIAYDKDIIAAPYPRKAINWNNVKTALKIYPDLNPEQLSLFAGDFVFGLLPENSSFDTSKPVEVEKVGTGCLLIKREVLEHMIHAHPEWLYYDLGTSEGKGAETYAVFDCKINQAKEYLSEDYNWCIEARKLGYKIWLAPHVVLNHQGMYTFTGSMPAVAAAMSQQQQNVKTKH